MINIQNLTFTYGIGQPAVLQDINLHIDEGEYLSIIGSNGCGKTTLIRHFNALLMPTAGEILVNGHNTKDPKKHRAIRCIVGMIFQNPDNQIVGMSVEEDVAFGPGNLGLPSAEIRRRVDWALSMVGLSGLEKRHPHTLSGGQKQLLALAGLLVMEPKLIVLDEPTASLDPAGKESVLLMFKQLNQQGIGIIHVTHDMDEIANANRILVMDKGRIVADGNKFDILRRVEWLKSLGLAPPRITELMWQLQQSGEAVGIDIFSVAGAVAEIGSLLGRLRHPSYSPLPKAAGYE